MIDTTTADRLADAARRVETADRNLRLHRDQRATQANAEELVLANREFTEAYEAAEALIPAEIRAPGPTATGGGDVPPAGVPVDAAPEDLSEEPDAIPDEAPVEAAPPAKGRKKS